MKKLMMGALAFSMFAVQCVSAVAESLVSIDSVQLMRLSKEGKVVDARLQKKAEAFNKFIEETNKKLAKLDEDVRSKAELLSASALQEKAQFLAREKKLAERAIADKREELQLDFQRERSMLAERQMRVANKLCVDNNWSMLVDRAATPGILFVAKAIDKTSELLTKVDSEFDAQQKNAAKAPAKKDVRAA